MSRNSMGDIIKDVISGSPIDLLSNYIMHNDLSEVSPYKGNFVSYKIADLKNGLSIVNGTESDFKGVIEILTELNRIKRTIDSVDDPSLAHDLETCLQDVTQAIDYGLDILKDINSG